MNLDLDFIFIFIELNFSRVQKYDHVSDLKFGHRIFTG